MAIALTELQNHQPATANDSRSAVNKDVLAIYHPSAHLLRTPEVQEVLNGLISLVLRQAHDGQINLQKVEVYGFRECE